MPHTSSFIPPMRILGIDPGTATVGYGVIEERDGRLTAVTFGVITTSTQERTAQRLQQIYNEISRLIDEHHPDTAAVEELFFGRNITSAFKVGQARGVLLLALANAGLPIGEYSPPKIKEAVSGYGKASKEQIQFMVQNILELDAIPRPDDAADGLAVAIAHYQHQRYEALTGVRENC